jgi:hypothetical protein
VTPERALSLLALAAAGLAGVIFLGRFARSFMRTFTEIIDTILGTEGQKGISDRLATIEHEMHPNSGQSLRDAINRIEKVATEAHLVATDLTAEVRRNSKEGKERRLEDHAAIGQLSEDLASLKASVTTTLEDR